MRYLLVLIVFVLPFALSAQKKVNLKKKYYGTYKGTIPAYKMDIGDEVVDVSSSTIMIEINKEKVNLAIGKNSLSGTYRVLFMAKTYYLLDVDVEGQLASERIMVYKRGKKLSRDGMYPQPVSELKKY